MSKRSTAEVDFFDTRKTPTYSLSSCSLSLSPEVAMFKQMAVFVLAIVTLVTISLPLAQAQFPGGAPYYSYYYPIYPTYTPAPVYYGYPLSFGGYTLYGTRGYTSFG